MFSSCSEVWSRSSWYTYFRHASSFPAGRAAIRALVGICVVLTMFMLPPSVRASTDLDPADAFVTDDAHELITSNNRLVVPIGKAEILPPLPFSKPQIGPIIKHGFDDDVERWTTAFIPGDLSNLTPVEFPDTDERWIRVDLSEQTVIAFEGDVPVRGFIVSSGLPRTPTVTGTYRIQVKVRSQNMTGGSRAAGNYYDLDNVEWVQYFYEDYSFHGTYWHNDFGTPKSHGCLNMTIADAKWLFDWAGPTWDGHTEWYGSTSDDPGTLVIITE
jgi:hypothetical protein